VQLRDASAISDDGGLVVWHVPAGGPYTVHAAGVRLTSRVDADARWLLSLPE
jgi:hypothetical protein